MNRKGVEMSVNTVIAILIALLFTVVVLFMVRSDSSKMYSLLDYIKRLF